MSCPVPASDPGFASGPGGAVGAGLGPGPLDGANADFADGSVNGAQPGPTPPGPASGAAHDSGAPGLPTDRTTRPSASAAAEGVTASGEPESGSCSSWPGDTGDARPEAARPGPVPQGITHPELPGPAGAQPPGPSGAETHQALPGTPPAVFPAPGVPRQDRGPRPASSGPSAAAPHGLPAQGAASCPATPQGLPGLPGRPVPSWAGQGPVTPLHAAKLPGTPASGPAAPERSPLAPHAAPDRASAPHPGIDPPRVPHPAPDRPGSPWPPSLPAPSGTDAPAHDPVPRLPVAPERHDRDEAVSGAAAAARTGSGGESAARCPVAHGGPLPEPRRAAAGQPENRAYALGLDTLHRLADDFVRLHHREVPAHGDPGPRLAAVHAEIDATGTYRHTPGELAFGARVAWRNSNRCIGRLYWNSLRVRDRRHVSDADTVAQECVEHLKEAGNGGRIRPLITVFAPDTPARPGPRIWNEQLIRYAGHTGADGRIVGDPRNTGLTGLAERLGWRGDPGSPFDVLPLIVQGSDDKPRLYELPDEAVLEVPLQHPEDTWAQDWGLRWHAVPAISHMCLEIGGICYPCAPFNGWYMGTEIGARDLADTDRYNLLPRLAEHLGLDVSSDRSLWKDRALVELNRAVLHSFDRAGISITDHHTESERFLTHLDREESKGRQVGADWSWIVPPMSSAATGVFHRTYDNTELTPLFTHHDDALARARGEALL
ncbi:nitric oxide synthase oxygenase [Streptomyces sp. NPDC088745]|uniref:nitric oxide synthase oxygenase n=1 Tax=Streptomyces sp. NPDC088745 TaxID=3365884 RepID=UPI003817CBC9